MWNVKWYLPGSILILLAIMIVMVPEILVALIATFIVMVGIGALYIGHMIRKAEIEIRDSDGWHMADDSHVWRFSKAPLFQRWYRKI
jgi:hypothetical protein